MATFNESIGSLNLVIDGVAGSPLVIQLDTPSSLIAAGQYITISGVVGATGANGDWTIASIAGIYVTLVGGAPGGAYVSGGAMTRKYATMQLWEVATRLNLVSLVRLYRGHCYQDAASDYTIGAASAAITIGGATTNLVSYRELLSGDGSARFDPRTLTGVQIQKTHGAASGAALILNEAFARVKGIGVQIVEGGVTSGSYIAVQMNANSIRLEAVWCKFAAGSGTCESQCFGETSIGNTHTIINCIAAGSGNATYGAFAGFNFQGNAHRIYNSAAYGCQSERGAALQTFGFAMNTAISMRNCIAIECVSSHASSRDFYVAATPTIFDRCISSDTSATTIGTVGCVGGQTSGQTFFYAFADDFRLSNTSAARDTGQALWSIFTTDITGAQRTNFWEIGPYDGFVAFPLATPTLIESTIGSAVGRDYFDIAGWELNTRGHLIAQNVKHRGIVYADSTFTQGAVTTTIAGSVVDDVRNRELVVADGNRYSALTGEGVKITGTNPQVLVLNERFFKMSGMSIENLSNSPARIAVEILSADAIIDGCFGRVLTSTGAGGAACFHGHRGANQSLRNCIAVGAVSAAGANYGVRLEGEYASALNCTVQDIVGWSSNGIGVKIGAASSRAVNCIALDCTTDFDTAASALCDYNLSSDATAAGAHSFINKLSSAVIFGAGDYRLVRSSPAINTALSLSSLFSTDFDGVPRNDPWEIGAYDGFGAKLFVAPQPIGRTGHLGRIFLLERVDGVVLAFTDQGTPFLYGDQIYLPAGGLDHSAARHVASLRHSNVELRTALTSDAITFEDLYAKKYHGAKVTVSTIDWRFPFAAPIEVSVYYIESLEFSNEEVIAQMSGLTHRLTQEVGSNLARNCEASLGDSKCKVDVSTYSAYAQTVTTVPGELSVFRASGVDGAYADEWFRFGRILWLTGNNAGTESEVLAYFQADREFEVQEPLPLPIQVGDTFDAIKGCDGRRSTCRTVFNNLVNFRGAPFSPGTDRMIVSPQR